MEEKAIGATPIGGNDRPSRTYGQGRVCHHPGCDTRLSVYNDGDYCYLHEPMFVPRVRGKKIA
jgi:hypothetical protein